MEIKTIEQIKEEYASERGYTSWRNLTWDSDVVSINKDVDVIALRYAINYATQLQPNIDLITTELCVQNERIAELEDALARCKESLDWVYENCTPPVFHSEEEADPQIEHILYRRQEIESLINKGK